MWPDPRLVLQVLGGASLFVGAWLVVWQLAIWTEDLTQRYFDWRRSRRLARDRARLQLAARLEDTRRRREQLEAAEPRGRVQ